MTDDVYIDPASHRRRPSRRISPSSGPPAPEVITRAFEGVAAQYGNTLLFVGYEVEGLIEVVVYPRYRFSSDDRVQGHIGYVHVPVGTPWAEILERVDAVYEAAQTAYRLAVTYRASEQRAHGARYEAAYEAITEVFRECWHAVSLKLGREGEITKEGITFKGAPPGPVLVTWREEPYTLMVFSSGSITLLRGDRRDLFRDFS